MEDPNHERGVIGEVDDEIVVIAVGGEIRRYRNNDTARLARLVELSVRVVPVQEHLSS